MKCEYVLVTGVIQKISSQWSALYMYARVAKAYRVKRELVIQGNLSCMYVLVTGVIQVNASCVH